MTGRLKNVRTPELEIAYEEDGHLDGWPVVLSHGFPYDARAYDQVIPFLTAKNARVIRPYLRGFGQSRFLKAETMRSGQQTALARDIVHLMDALGIEKAVLAGYDWGGLASCVASLLWPGRVTGLVSLASYDVIDVSAGGQPCPPSLENVLWYQHYFQTARGRDGLRQDRRGLCRILWDQWSPGWSFDDDVFERTAASFDTPDFVDVVIHHYRWAFGLSEGDASLSELEDRIARRPAISVPAVTLDGTLDPLKPGGTSQHAAMFNGPRDHRSFDVGHNLPQEAPEDFADAVLSVFRMAEG
ncbi:alpha/beta fold hydrolase [Marinibacterium sp. SX1]|uniref:alpha/beta fold hydrolase n=1 Tax=Marinibacterium sp. SX1 TaxID=3388424 RepID=UPI003D16AA39